LNSTLVAFTNEGAHVLLMQGYASESNDQKEKGKR
jgi:hypothetical protein